jgi:hypothetical protein
LDRLLVRAARARPLAFYDRTVRPNSRDACGCAMGERFLAAALVIATLWYGWQWQTAGLSLEAMVVGVSAWSFLAAGAGKIVGIATWRRRARHPSNQ